MYKAHAFTDGFARTVVLFRLSFWDALRMRGPEVKVIEYDLTPQRDPEQDNDAAMFFPLGKTGLAHNPNDNGVAVDWVHRAPLGFERDDVTGKLLPT